jgi:hypothetical protein
MLIIRLLQITARPWNYKEFGYDTCSSETLVSKNFDHADSRGKGRSTFSEWSFPCDKRHSEFSEWHLSGDGRRSEFVEWHLSGDESHWEFVEWHLSADRSHSEFVEWHLSGDESYSEFVEWQVPNDLGHSDYSECTEKPVERPISSFSPSSAQWIALPRSAGTSWHQNVHPERELIQYRRLDS